MPRRRKASPLPALPVHFVDTNVLLRYLIGDDPSKAKRAAELMKRVEAGNEEIIITDEVLVELVWTLESFYKVPRVQIATRLIALLSFPKVRMAARDVSRESLHVFAATSADFPDCLLAVRSRHRDIPVYTFDRTDFGKLDWQEP